MSDELIKDYLPSNFIPTEMDVVCARGKEAYLHPGNKRYRDIITNNLTKYRGAGSKNQKSYIVILIVEKVRCDAPAGFVRYCETEQLWYEIGDEAAREKVGQTIRETLTQRDPTKLAKKRIKRAINKVNRIAAKEAFELEPLPVDQAIDVNLPFSSMICNSTASHQPLLPLVSSSPPVVTDLMKETFNDPPVFQRLRTPSFLTNNSDDWLQHHQQKSGYSQLPSSAALNASMLEGMHLQGQSLLVSLPLIAPSMYPSTAGLRFQQDLMSRPAVSRPMACKDIGALASVTPPLHSIPPRGDWGLDTGYDIQDTAFDEIEDLFNDISSVKIASLPET